MPLRTARVEDEPAIATLCTAAFWEEDCFCRVILPKQEDYPDDVQIFWHEWLRADWQERSKVIPVAVVGDEEQATVKTRMSGQEMKRSEDLVEDTGDKVVGVAVWQRKGDDEHAQRVKDEWVDPGQILLFPSSKTSTRVKSINLVNYSRPQRLPPTQIDTQPRPRPSSSQYPARSRTVLRPPLRRPSRQQLVSASPSGAPSLQKSRLRTRVSGVGSEEGT
jgi:hypothetical protein